jgi:hypothetical protein
MAAGRRPWPIGHTRSSSTDGDGAVTERRIGFHAAGTLLDTSVTIISNTVAHGRRTVRLSRPLTGASAQHFTFNASASGLPCIAAVGTSAHLSYHGSRGGGAVLLV